MDFTWLSEALGSEAAVFIISMVPVVELRLAIPWGAAIGLSWFECLFLSVAGNSIIVPFAILLIRPIFGFLRKLSPFFNKMVDWMEERAMKKSDTVRKYSILGLMLLVAVPLPGTGAWTGCIIATLLDMRMKYALPSIVLGVLIAGILVTGATYGFLHLTVNL